MKVNELHDVLQKLLEINEGYENLEIGLSTDMNKIHYMRTINRVQVRDTESDVTRQVLVFAVQSAQEIVDIGKREGAPVDFLEH